MNFNQQTETSALGFLFIEKNWLFNFNEKIKSSDEIDIILENFKVKLSILDTLNLPNEENFYDTYDLMESIQKNREYTTKYIKKILHTSKKDLLEEKDGLKFSYFFYNYSKNDLFFLPPNRYFLYELLLDINFFDLYTNTYNVEREIDLFGEYAPSNDFYVYKLEETEIKILYQKAINLDVKNKDVAYKYHYRLLIKMLENSINGDIDIFIMVDE